MGLSKKLRSTVEEIVFEYVREHDDNHRQRLESLEEEVSLLVKKIAGPNSLRVPNVELQTSLALAKIGAFMTNEGIYNCKGETPEVIADIAIRAIKDMLGTPEHESVHSRLRRLREVLLESHDEEDIRGAGVVDAAIAYIRSLEEEDEENEAAAKTWSPAELIGRIPDRKLDNEVRARIVDGENRIDLTMIVRQNPVGKGYGSALPVIRVPSPYGSTLILVPADLPTEFTAKLFSRMLPAGYDPSGDPIQCKFMHNYVSFLVHFFDRDKVKWLPEQAEITFRMSDWLPVNGVVLGKGIPLRQVIEEYGEGAETFAVLGSLFLEATFSPLPVPQPEAAPESPDAPPAAPQSP